MRKLGRDILTERAKQVVAYLKESKRWVKLKEVTKATGLTEGQVKCAVKFERRWFLESPEKCGSTYILSGARGYKLPESDEDYIAMYKTLYAWGKSVLVTISPIGKYLAEKGFDVVAMRKDAMEHNGLIHDSVGGVDAWQED